MLQDAAGLRVTEWCTSPPPLRLSEATGSLLQVLQELMQLVPSCLTRGNRVNNQKTFSMVEEKARTTDAPKLLCFQGLWAPRDLPRYDFFYQPKNLISPLSPANSWTNKP